ncbi:tetratricopeptide repeat protein [Roseiconus nitratireducens]|uniref:Tetratricopeptide repeat protein n=1 Tax=Roseiconus nitratireducens TaxID=2605748 RepID=A0A5M6CSG4_9BACT|nr:tetratricopeptide repeat protein [Roseiconus nitratireducens]KAA5536079.1 tetratricopeptide repeat protein [Roseiconus nitratireducens]
MENQSSVPGDGNRSSLNIMLRFICLLLIATTTASSTAVACINEYGTTASGDARLRSHSRVPSAIPINVARYRAQVEELTPKVQNAPTHEDLSNLAVAHLYLGDTQRAIELLLQAESITPGEYVVASNLGTAYELAGRNEEALTWIEEGIRRNPSSHVGSEWVHVNLLKAKMALEKDRTWLEENSVTGLDFGDDAIPVFDASESAPNCPGSLTDIAIHLDYQLYERRSFVPGPDPIVAAMMFDLANATALADTIEDAKPIYAASVELGYHDPAFALERQAALEGLESRNILSGWTYDTLALSAVLLLGGLAVAGAVLWRFSRTSRATN